MGLLLQLSWHPTQVLTTLTFSFGIYGFFKLLHYIYSQFACPLRDLPGPPNGSLLWGNSREMWEGELCAVQEKWVQNYGETYRFYGPLSSTRLFSMDVKLINHVLSNCDNYQKPEGVIYGIKRMVGEGVLVVEGDRHKRQNPAFGPRQIREITEIFVEKSIELRDIWISEASKQNTDETCTIDALSWLSRTTLDVIGLAGFNYKFDTLTKSPETDELSSAFAVVFKAGMKLDFIAILRGMFPFTRFLRAPRDKEVNLAKTKMFQIATDLLEESKASLSRDGDTKSSSRDLLSVLVRANTITTLSSTQRLTDDEVLAQIPTFLVAGHETTSVATTWAIYALTQSKDVQAKLRAELLGMSTDNPSMDELNSLPYLDLVVRETLRLHSPVSGFMRMAMKDEVVPLNTPFVDRHGNSRSELLIKKGTILNVPVVVLNTAKSIWGDDAKEFKPGRWEELPEAVSSIPGVWSNMMTFLGGPRACIGYRFSIVEMKTILFTLVRAFELDLAVPGSDIVKKSGLIRRPVLVTDNSNQLPLVIRPLTHS
ncbi:cytochrome P450 [Crepidotus variabilis]|uniref:Cytochrome P450 n=1 Tax=Crepidotus variabilis TaxID=179855 RepID=A0A9P6JUP6_9AGAR|nr:cytochrome P450 [Crepidotus variabilis]